MSARDFTYKHSLDIFSVRRVQVWDIWGAIDPMGGCPNFFCIFLVDYRYTYLDINCK